MKQSIKKLWVAALRSGDYKQGLGSLNRDSRYCCLGVLCDLAVKAGVEVHVTEEDGNVSYDTNDGYPPLSVVRWAGLDRANPEVEGIPFGDGPRSLASLNDSGYSFAGIANLIEEQL